MSYLKFSFLRKKGDNLIFDIDASNNRWKFISKNYQKWLWQEY